MANPKKFFHDQLVLLLLTVNAFLVLVVIVSVLLQLGSSNTANYIVQYRPSFGEVNSFRTGSIIELFSFIVFGLLALITHTLLSIRAYRVRRQLALAILSLGILLQLLNVIISNALLSLR